MAAPPSATGTLAVPIGWTHRGGPYSSVRGRKRRREREGGYEAWVLEPGDRPDPGARQIEHHHAVPHVPAIGSGHVRGHRGLAVRPGPHQPDEVDRPFGGHCGEERPDLG